MPGSHRRLTVPSLLAWAVRPHDGWVRISHARLQVGQILGERYWLQEHLGRGAVADVFRARHVRMDREFAVKVMHPHLLADATQCRRFEREAELAGKLRHHNVIGVIDVGETARSRFVVMDLVDGPTLATLLAAGEMDEQRVIDLVVQICDGLEHAHAHGVVHRDLKPENIVIASVDDGEIPRIVDFGLAFANEDAEPDDRLTTAGVALGTPHYMAPEIALGQNFDHRADLFALGVVMYEMLTGKLPFDGEGVDVIRANVGAQIPAMSARASSIRIDPRLEELTRHLLAKRPDDRPASAADVRTRLLAIAASAGPDRAGSPQGVHRSSAAAEPVAADAAVDVSGDAGPSPGDDTTLVTPDPVVTGERDGETFVDALDGDPEDDWTEVTRSSRRTRRIAVAIGVALVASIVWLATRTSTVPRHAPVTARSTAPALPAARTAVVGPRAQPDRAEVVSIPSEPIAAAPAADPPAAVPARPAAPIAVEAPVHRPRAVRGPRDAHASPDPAPAPGLIAAPAAPMTVEAPPASTQVVIDLYQRVGRALKARRTGTDDVGVDHLWQLYRRVRIHDALVSSGQRAEAINLLTTIEGALANQPGRDL